jgi:GST-like protein
MIDFYFAVSPNSLKVAILLEEVGLPYRLRPIDIHAGDQHTPEFRAINPNGKIPAIRDGDAVIFDSTAILLHLAYKHDCFISSGEVERGQMLSWLMFVASGIGPFSGQAAHFKYFAPPDNHYAANRYTRELDRHYDVLESRLDGRLFLSGSEYSIADIAAWGWVHYYPRQNENAFSQFPAVARWYRDISARPATQRALILKEDDTKRELDENARRNLFPQNYPADANPAVTAGVTVMPRGTLE